MISESITFRFENEEQQRRFHERLKSEASCEARLSKGIAEIRDELNQLALLGAVPLWSSLLGRLDDLEERIVCGTHSC